MRIDIFQDMVCPWCRIGKTNLYRALEMRGGEPPELRWRAFMLDPSVPEEGLPFMRTMQQKYGEQFSHEGMLGRVTEAGRSVGLTFDFRKVEYMPNTRLSHRMTAIAPDEFKAPLVDAIHRAYFEEGRNIGDRAVLMRIAEETGLDANDLADRLDRGEGEAEIEEDFEMAKRIGITGVPFFIIGRKFGLSGAQPPEAFLNVFRRLEEQA
ncbi:DsbA family oxidoreductase [Paenibacillus flagellatus]|uniref:DsbA family oxidoreductase n=1 Tax=Paenibacillus flagellatus TaxID=2211139 RepID=A0A2V5K0B2_9BACL|nr:DsbA family oxidoreductase [Paenibacillus flagellatus]PYI52568.1 DsbA family oxidoreductase [Paenibacillus flagellatus]